MKKATKTIATATANHAGLTSFVALRDVESMEEYKDGVRAFVLGLNPDLDCPYPSDHAKSALRTRWMSGYYGEWTRQLLLRLEVKYHITTVRS